MIIEEQQTDDEYKWMLVDGEWIYEGRSTRHEQDEYALPMQSWESGYYDHIDFYCDDHIDDYCYQ